MNRKSDIWKLKVKPSSCKQRKGFDLVTKLDLKKYSETLAKSVRPSAYDTPNEISYAIDTCVFRDPTPISVSQDACTQTPPLPTLESISSENHSLSFQIFSLRSELEELKSSVNNLQHYKNANKLEIVQDLIKKLKSENNKIRESLVN